MFHRSAPASTMSSSLGSSAAQSAGPPPPQFAALLMQAQALQRAAVAGQERPAPLRGKNIGLLCDTVESSAAARFRHAATELGAQVAHVRPSLSAESTPNEVRHTARILGRLYDALECQGMPASVVKQLGEEAGVPVYDGLGSAGHPTALVADWLPEPATPAERQRWVMQAVLLGALA